MSNIRNKLAGKTTKLSQKSETRDEHPSFSHDYTDGKFLQVDIETITPDPDQPRKYFNEDSLNELSESVKQKGVLQPVLIRIENKKPVLVAGERRFRAAKIAGLTKIPAILTTGNPAEIALIENLQREDLRPVEEAEALQKMMREYNYTHAQLAGAIGKGRSTITEMLTLNKLPEIIKDECRRADNFPRRLLVEIAKQEDEEKMIELFEAVKKQDLNSSDLRKLTRKRKERRQKTSGEIAIQKTRGLIKTLQELNLDSMEESERIELLKMLGELKQMLNDLLS